jgi:hypothetical protein
VSSPLTAAARDYLAKGWRVEHEGPTFIRLSKGEKANPTPLRVGVAILGLLLFIAAGLRIIDALLVLIGVAASLLGLFVSEASTQPFLEVILTVTDDGKVCAFRPGLQPPVTPPLPPIRVLTPAEKRIFLMSFTVVTIVAFAAMAFVLPWRH